MSDYNRSPIVNPIPTSILLIFFGIILVEAFLIFGFGGPLGKTETTIERLLRSFHGNVMFGEESKNIRYEGFDSWQDMRLNIAL